MLSNTLSLNFCYLKIIDIFHPRYSPRTIEHILKSNQKNKCVSIQEIRQLIIMKMKVKMKNRLIGTTQIDLGIDMGSNMVNINSVAL